MFDYNSHEAGARIDAPADNLIADARKHVLIIDDEMEIRLDIAELLTSLGYRVTTAKNGADGLRLLKETDSLPDLITIDFCMPQKDGLEFYQDFKNLRLQRQIPLIFISGYLQKEDVQGHAVLLEKPLDRLEFIQTVERLMKTTMSYS